jgi:hypothetical protein
MTDEPITDDEAAGIEYARDVALRKLHKDWADPPQEMIGYLPRISCKACSNGHCQEHRKIRCPRCGSWISEKHVDIEFVGHADVTRILLEEDPLWNWEPVAWNADGEPLLVRRDGNLRMWGRLTVHGVTRLGVGTVTTDSFEAEKQLIGDFIRNAAMRFGIAVGLWSKGDRAEATLALAAGPQPEAATSPSGAPAGAVPADPAQIQELTALAAELDDEQKAAMRAWVDAKGFDMKHLDGYQAEEVIVHLNEVLFVPADGS